MHPIQDESSDANSISKRLIELRNAGLTPMETIKALRVEFDLSLAEAKDLFARSLTWVVEVAAGDTLHAQIMTLDSDSEGEL
jgi:ribosomal protein L7/L12